MSVPALERAIQILGSQAALAGAVGVTQQAVSYWLRNGGKVAAEFVLPIERATESQVTRTELRPDLYPSEPAATDAAAD